MNKIKVGIVGYGNLGKALEEVLSKEQNIQVVGIFSKRNNIVSTLGTPIVERSKLDKFKSEIDILSLCSGSKTDMVFDAPLFAKDFNIINSFDTHELISSEFEKLNVTSQNSGTISIISCGWDPGVFSITKAMFYSILGIMPTCFYGRGTSLGHSAAVRKIDGVKNAVAFTIPNEQMIEDARNGKHTTLPLHSREVFVCANENANKEEIENTITNMDFYFKNQPTRVQFVSEKELNSIMSFSHTGRVVVCEKNNNRSNSMELNIKMDSNPMFTAKIMASYIKVFDKLKNKYKSGAYTPLHFSPLDLLDTKEIEAIKKFM